MSRKIPPVYARGDAPPASRVVCVEAFSYYDSEGTEQRVNPGDVITPSMFGNLGMNSKRHLWRADDAEAE